MSDAQTAGVAKPPRKQQKRSLVTQQKLLDAAIAAFSENGYKGTSTRDIAERAGVHHPLITYHFKNKEQLWRAAVDKIFSDFNVEFEKALSIQRGEDVKIRAIKLVRAYLKHTHRQPALHKIVVQESNQPSRRLEWLSERHLRPLREVIVAHLEELQRIGVAPQGNTALLYNMMRACAGGLIALAHEVKSTSNIDLQSDDGLDELANMVVRVFLPGDMPGRSARHDQL